MKNSTQRAIRTAVQTLLGVSVGIGVLAPSLPKFTGRPAVIAAAIIATAATVAKVYNVADDRGLLPKWLSAVPTELPADLFDGAWHAGYRARQLGEDANEAFRTQAADMTLVDVDRRPTVDADTAEHERVAHAADVTGALPRVGGRHSVDRTGEPPTSLRARRTGPFSAAAPGH